MKKYLSLFLILTIAFVFSAKVVKAEGNQIAGNDDSAKPALYQERQQIRQEVQEAKGQVVQEIKTFREKNVEERKAFMEMKKGELKQLREETQVKLKEMRKKNSAERLEKQLRARANVVEGIAHRIDNLGRITDRVKSRIEKIKEESPTVDTSEAEDLVATAEENVALAITKITNVRDAVENGDTLEVIKENILAVKEAFKTAHTSLVDVVKDLKEKLAEKKDIKKVEDDASDDEADQ